MQNYKNYINGQFKDSVSKKTFLSINPSNEEPWAEISEAENSEVNEAVEAADNAFKGEWSKYLPQQRAKILRNIGDKLLENSDLLGSIETKDTGKMYKETIPNVDRGLNAGDKLVCGNLTLKIMDTPGHTMSHICLYFEGNDTNKPALFCGDTLFNAGVGRCDFGGDPIIMHQTFEEQIFLLSDNVRIYPGHDYIENNLEFTLDREPDNQSAKELKEKFNNGLDAESFISDIGLERQINVFFRLDEHRVRLGIADSLKIDVASLDRQKTFVGLRGLRDNW